MPGSQRQRPLTDLGNAERFVTAHAKIVKYCPPRRRHGLQRPRGQVEGRQTRTLRRSNRPLDDGGGNRHVLETL
jgi:hypothetical protein